MSVLTELIAASADTPTFDGVDLSARVVVAGSGVADATAVNEIAERYEAHGFALVQLDGESGSPEPLCHLAESLDLGDAFVPPLYGATGAPSIATISAARNAGTADESHPSFGHTKGQSLHTDGTLQDIGYVKTTLLLCQSPAAEGGESTLFNATGAYARLLAEDAEAALALATPGALIRQANINGCSDANHGPAFAVVDGQLVTRYSLTATDRWAVPDGVAESALQRGITFLSAATKPHAGYHLTFTMSAGQVLVLANTRLSHGRGRYRDSASARRCMFRSLHLRQPSMSRVLAQVQPHGQGIR